MEGGTWELGLGGVSSARVRDHVPRT
ncbi:uncharacterized protein G2W53_035754 [Senna tora]|uniref:Uncharacterized protein n=1 Tax=Senna tora TaxID=362788 RepID=A0A834STR3_9FABA|nr:uncharacterized protein G2W53_035754 [Senna tora]